MINFRLLLQSVSDQQFPRDHHVTVLGCPRNEHSTVVTAVSLDGDVCEENTDTVLVMEVIYFCHVQTEDLANNSRDCHNLTFSIVVRI